MNMTNETMSQLDLIPIGGQCWNSHHKHYQQNRKSEKEKRTYQQTWSQTHHRQTHHQANLICQVKSIAENPDARTNIIQLMISNTANPKSSNAIKRKSVRKTRNRTRQTQRQEILIRPTKMTIDARDKKIRRSTGERILSNYAQG